MFSTASFSEFPFASLIVNTSVTLSGVSATASLGSIEAKTLESLLSVSATASVGTITVNISEELGSVSGTTALTAVQPNVAEKIGNVSATGNVGTLTVTGTANHTPTGVSATGTIAPVVAGGFEIDVGEALISVAATTAVGSVQPNIVEKLDSVSGAANTPFVQPVVSPTEQLTGVSGTTGFGAAQANVTEPVESVNATVTVNGAVTLTATSNITLTGFGMVLSLGTVNVTAVVFDFEAVKDTYSRNRLAYVERQTTSADRTAEVVSVPRTIDVYRSTTAQDRTALVMAENRMVYVERQSTSAERTAEAA